MKNKFLPILALILTVSFVHCGKKSEKKQPAVENAIEKKSDLKVDLKKDDSNIKPEDMKNAPIKKADKKPEPKIIKPEYPSLTEKDFLAVKPEENWKLTVSLPKTVGLTSVFSPDGKIFAYMDNQKTGVVLIADTSNWKILKVYEIKCESIQISSSHHLLCDQSPTYKKHKEPSSDISLLKIIDLKTDKIIENYNNFNVIEVKKCEFADAAAEYDCDAASITPSFSDDFKMTYGITLFNNKPLLSIIKKGDVGLEVDDGFGFYKLPLRKHTEYKAAFSKDKKYIQLHEKNGWNDHCVRIFNVSSRKEIEKHCGNECTISNGFHYSCSNFSKTEVYRIGTKEPVLRLPGNVKNKELHVKHISSDGMRLLIGLSYLEYYSVTTDGKSVIKIDSPSANFGSASHDGRYVFFHQPGKLELYSSLKPVNEKNEKLPDIIKLTSPDLDKKAEGSKPDDMKPENQNAPKPDDMKSEIKNAPKPDDMKSVTKNAPKPDDMKQNDSMSPARKSNIPATPGK